MNSKKHVKLENLSAVYDPKTNNVSIIGERGSFDNGFRITLKQGTVEDTELRSKLFENGVKNLDFSRLNYYPEDLPPRLNQIPLGKDENSQEVFWKMEQNRSRGLFISGKAASGKTTLLNHIQELLLTYYSDAEFMSLDNGANLRYGIGGKSSAEAMLNKLMTESSTKTRFLFIDEIDVVDTKTYSMIEPLLRMARSRNIYVFITGRSMSRISKTLHNFCDEVSMNVTNLNEPEAARPDFQRYGMISKESTELFVPYLPQSMKN